MSWINGRPMKANAKRTARWRSRLGAEMARIQTLGGRNRGRMGASLIRRDRPGGMRSRTVWARTLACRGALESGWKHLSRQLPMSGHGSAQPGQG